MDLIGLDEPKKYNSLLKTPIPRAEAKWF